MKQKLKSKKLEVITFALLMIVAFIGAAFADTCLFSDNFNDNSLAGCWTALHSGDPDYNWAKEETQKIHMQVLPIGEGTWRSAAVKLDNDYKIENHTTVWVDITQWGTGNYNWGKQFWNGPRVAELVLSNEVYSPMSSHRRVAVKRENYEIGGEMFTQTFATTQYGTNTTRVPGSTIYNYPGPEEGYTMAFGIECVPCGPQGWEYKFYVWSSYDDEIHQLGQDVTGGNPKFVGDYPYPIFGAYENDYFCGAIWFDDFCIWKE
jgi:hypothetical protein